MNNYVFRTTIGQVSNPKWLLHRRGRITSSNFKKVASAKKKSAIQRCINQVLQPHIPTWEQMPKAIRCGINKETEAKSAFIRHMSRKGTPLDNAVVESFFHSLKTELVHQRRFSHDIAAVTEIIKYIEFYNRERLHSGIGYQAPEEYEQQCA